MEKIANGHPHIYFREQLILTEKKPKYSCRHCKGLGYIGLWKEKPQPRLTITRNQPCPCKSGKKFKRCCGDIVERMRMSGGSIITCGCVGKAEMVKENPELDKMREAMQQLQNQPEHTNQLSVE